MLFIVKVFFFSFLTINKLQTGVGVTLLFLNFRPHHLPGSLASCPSEHGAGFIPECSHPGEKWLSSPSPEGGLGQQPWGEVQGGGDLPAGSKEEATEHILLRASLSLHFRLEDPGGCDGARADVWAHGGILQLSGVASTPFAP